MKNFRLGVLSGVALAAAAFIANPTLAAIGPEDAVRDANGGVDIAHRHGAIMGKVYVGDGRGVPGAIVVLRTPDGRGVARTESGDDGIFGFRRVRPGHYYIEASRRGVGSGKARVSVETGKISRVRVELTH